MKLALITADKGHGVQFKAFGGSDTTSFMNWAAIWGGFHFSFYSLGEDADLSFLRDFDVVMFSGNLLFITSIIRIAKYLKDSNAITVFFPEGSTQLYDNSINGFHPEYYEAWNACDILASVEEDKTGYYESFVTKDTLVRFIHVPISPAMEQGQFYVPRQDKDRNLAVIYGDNNPNHPLIALACAQRLGMNVVAVDLREAEIKRAVPQVNIIQKIGKTGQDHYLRLLGKSFIHFYPTEWIGTAREQISCAVTGTPCIGNEDSHTQQRLWPALSSPIYDIDWMVSLAEKLNEDQKFYDGCVKQAYESAKFYSLETTKKRFVDAVDAARVKFKAVQV